MFSIIIQYSSEEDIYLKSKANCMFYLSSKYFINVNSAQLFLTKNEFWFLNFFITSYISGFIFKVVLSSSSIYTFHISWANGYQASDTWAHISPGPYKTNTDTGMHATGNFRRVLVLVAGMHGTGTGWYWYCSWYAWYGYSLLYAWYGYWHRHWYWHLLSLE